LLATARRTRGRGRPFERPAAVRRRWARRRRRPRAAAGWRRRAW